MINVKRELIHQKVFKVIYNNVKAHKNTIFQKSQSMIKNVSKIKMIKGKGPVLQLQQ